MNLNIDEWKPFITGKLFPVMKPGKANQQLLDEGDDCFYVGAKKDDNGVMFHCAWDESLVQEGNCIIFICNGQGSVGYANYMDIDFIGTTDIVAGYNEYLNPLIGNFLATVYSLERPKYSFGRKWKTHLKSTEVKLPVLRNEDGSVFIDSACKFSDQGYVPDWKFMENYMRTLRYKALSTQNKEVSLSLFKDKWKDFEMGRIFDIKKGKRLTAEDQEPGTTPYIGAIDSNNGVANMISQKPIHEGNTISLSYNGSVGEAFYQDSPFWATDDVNVLYPRFPEFNKWIGLFLCTVIKLEKYKYSYGRKWILEKMNTAEVKLPVLHNEDGSVFIDSAFKFSDQGYVPDWKFMENYIKALPFGDRL